MKPLTHTDLLSIDPKPRDLYDTFSLAHLTAYSVYWLTAWEIPTTYENISVLNARLFPTKFSLAGFPNMPDAMATNRTIMQMRPKYRGFATSDPRRGVYLTERGRNEAVKVNEAVGGPTLNEHPLFVTEGLDVSTAAKPRTRSPDQIIAQRKEKLLYRRYTEGRLNDTDIVHLLGLVSLYDHTPRTEVKKALDQLRRDATTIGDTGFLRFLDDLEARFAAYIRGTR